MLNRETIVPLNTKYIMEIRGRFTISRLDPNKQEDLAIVNQGLFAFMSPIFILFYPNFEKWYFDKIAKGFLNNERIIYVIKSVDSIKGVAIIRKYSEVTHKSNKICSFYVLPEARVGCLGNMLFSKCLNEFVDSHEPVIITVPEERAVENINEKMFIDFLKYYGFKVVSIAKGKYRPGKTNIFS